MPKSVLGSMIKKSQLSMKNSNFKLLNNKYLLYVILFLSISDLLLFLMAGEFAFAVMFILIGLITSFFSKNMIVILTSAMILTNVLKYGSKIRKEGMENEDMLNNVDLEGYYEQLSNEEKEHFENIVEGKEEKPNDLNSDEEQLFEGLLNIAEKKCGKDTFEGREGATGGRAIPKKTKKPIIPKKPKKSNLVGFKEFNTHSMPKREGLNALETKTDGLIESQNQLIENMNKLEPMLQQAESFMQNFQTLDKN